MNVEKAYRKFKSHIYNDNTLLHARVKLAEFEADKEFEIKLKDLNKAIEKCTINNFDPLDEYIDKITYLLTPKNIKNGNNLPDNVYINKKIQSAYEIEDFNIFIHCPIEIHLISVLWIMEVGHLLDQRLESNINGYRLVRNSDGNIEEDSFKLFEKYHERYILFRDGALQKAINLHKQKLDTTILNLDIKSFFYNISFNFETECEKYSHNASSKKLNKIMNIIHDKYQNILISDKIEIEDKARKIIPIGLLSSSIISNYALIYFDKDIVTKVKPAFYSRYVDDMLLVLTNTSIDEKHTIEKLLSSCIFKGINFTYDKKNDSILFETNNNKFTFQNKKIKIFHFLKTDSVHLLEKFSKTITKNSSLFKLLPEDKDIFNTLEEASYNINYSSSINKISSINGNSLDILNISRNIVQMTKIIMNTNYSNEEIEEYNSQLSSIFIGQNILDLQRLWEKVFTYLFISNSEKEFISFSKRVINVILNIKYNDDIIAKRLINNVAEYFANSISMAISLYPNDFKNKFLKELGYIYTKNIDTKILEVISQNYIIPRANNIRKANLIRHYMVSSIPLSNYCKSMHPISYYKNKISIKDFKFNIDDKKIKYSPRFIHYHEISIFYHLKYLHNKMSNAEKNSYIRDIEDFIFDKYNIYNKTPQFKEKYPIKTNLNDVFINNNYYHNISVSPKKNKFNIALVNIKVNAQDSINSFKGKPNLSFHRLLDIFEVLNTAKKTNCDMIIFPEISIPYNWLKLISDFSKMNDIAIIFGMEHFSINKCVFNFSVAILPFQVNQYTNTYIHFNLKSHYAPHEKLEIEGNGYTIPTSIINTNQIDIYKWKNTVFSIFNCYELSNIQARSKLVGENDFTVAIEYNSDTNYFSNIVGSISRDNHAYIVQVNSSQYGDSRITQPTKSEIMDIIKVKGGKYTSLLSGQIDIKKLRDFQLMTHSLQIIEQSKNKYKTFKLTPPGFEISDYRK